VCVLFNERSNQILSGEQTITKFSMQLYGAFVSMRIVCVKKGSFSVCGAFKSLVM
jgi:hypothetical protein